MRVSPLPVVAVLLSLLLAGCSGDAETPTDDEKIAEETGISDVPEWTEGMYWTYDSPNGVASYVVTDATGADYLVEANDKGVAYYEAKYDSAFQGLIRKSDLAGSEDGQRVVMFDWPLEPNKQWTTTWDGERLDMFANPMGEGQYHVMGHQQSDGAMAVEYHYNRAVQWFEYIVFYNTTSGEESYRLDLRDRGDSFSGTVYRYTLGDPIVIAADATQSGVQEEDIDADWNELGLHFEAVCGGDEAGQIFVGLNDPDTKEGNPAPMVPVANEARYGMMHDCQSGQVGMDMDVVPNPGGTWEVGLLVGAPNGGAQITVELRSLEEVSIG